jgi:hypothetical protein
MGNVIRNFDQLQKEFLKNEDKCLPQNSKQEYLEFIIVKKSQFIYNYLKLTLLLNDEINDQFIYKQLADIKENTKIKVKLDDIKFKTINNTLYFEIQKIKFLKSISQNILNEHYNHFNFTFHASILYVHGYIAYSIVKSLHKCASIQSQVKDKLFSFE